MASTAHTTNKEYASKYRENSEERDPQSITPTTLKLHTLDITYTTPHGTKTVRSTNAIPKASYNDIPDGFHSFHYDGQKYAYNPEKTQLISINTNQNHTLATKDDIQRIEKIDFPTAVPVKGNIDTDVDATVYYRSPRSDTMQSVTITVQHMEGIADVIYGADNTGERQIEATTRWERDIKSRHRTEKRTLGKVTRVEFPRGHQFTVDLEGMDNATAENHAEEQIEKALRNVFQHTDSVTVTHDGELNWD